eukprot:7590106-Lingulodinium_polyedra.AAC.1
MRTNSAQASILKRAPIPLAAVPHAHTQRSNMYAQRAAKALRKRATIPHAAISACDRTSCCKCALE